MQSGSAKLLFQAGEFITARHGTHIIFHCRVHASSITYVFKITHIHNLPQTCPASKLTTSTRSLTFILLTVSRAGWSRYRSSVWSANAWPIKSTVFSSKPYFLAIQNHRKGKLHVQYGKIFWTKLSNKYHETWNYIHNTVSCQEDAQY